MSQPELLKTAVRFLSQNSIPYMVTGSIASSLQGEPRASHDIDLVVQIDMTGANALVRAFPAPRYYLSETAIRDALREKTTFNLLDTIEGDKIDFWLLTDEPFDASRFARRQMAELFGTPIALSAPEDTILAKLRWARLSGGSEKQFIDALRVYELQYPMLDQPYLEHWAARLQVQELWARLCEEAEPLE